MARSTRVRSPGFSAASLGLILVLALGCRDERGPMRPPETPLARESLAKALEAWKSGRKGGGLIGSAPAVGVVDTLQAERPLVDFDIVGALFPLAEARPFAVRLTLDAPREVVSARYLVLGSDPIWVFRDEDYQLILHWEHKMPPDEDEAASRAEPEDVHAGPEAH